ncbi:hypothetical protein N7517_011261 [Penicillium concentricum]|uniref:Uncharacterized protein n=1 Tax=Penicillium concentricum TaxID=293559 RepID=A0A9W9UTD4_9EURO|nr:uncharacterized protein N7517_011261 [Penicillium concentricum]KAJ5356652.1 hypothetical protein N7517_011261 [Penicillium concentricum]
MPTNFPTLRSRSRRRIADHLQARNQVIGAVTQVYNRIERYSSAQVDPASYKFLGIDFGLLQLDENGSHLHPTNYDPSDLTFFEPRGASWVPPVVITNPNYADHLRVLTEEWDTVQDHLLIFYPRHRDGRVPPNLRQMSQWLESGDMVPSVVADKFYSAIFGSIRWSLSAAFVPKTLLYPSGVPPHTMIMILIGEQPSEELLRVEVMTITAVMITRLEGEESLAYNTIPVMAITIFGQLKARVIEAHTSQQGVVIKKARLFDFSTNELANKSMNILLGFMCADLVGDPKGPIFLPNIVGGSPKADKSEVAKGGTLRKLFGKRRPRAGSDAESELPEEVLR